MGAEILEYRAMLSGMAANLGVVRGQSWFLDTDGNTAAHEIDFNYGLAGDHFVAGNWDGLGTKAGVVRQPGQNGAPNNGLLHWYLDLNGDPAAEQQIAFGLPGDIPVIGDWDGNGTDNIGVVRLPGVNGAPNDGLLHWYFDTNGDPNAELQRAYGLPGDIPVVGDWNQSGRSQIGVVRTRPDGFMNWLQDLNGDIHADRSFIFGYAPAGDKPIVGDWEGIGGDNAGVVRPPAAGQGSLLTWLLDTNNDPTPDIARQYGIVGDKPVVGHWRLPEINVVGVVNGQPVPAVNFGSVMRGATISDRTFTVQNLGTATLQITRVTLERISGVNSRFEIRDSSPGTLAPGQSRQFSVRMNTSEVGASTARVHLYNNDGNELDFTFLITGVVFAPAPEIDIVGIVDGQAATVNFGTFGLNAPARKVFTVKNNGTATLTLGAISLPPRFSVIEGLRPSLEPGETDTFTVAMETSVAGTFSGALSVANNDADENPYNFLISGTCVAPPTTAPEIDIVGVTDGQAAVIDFGSAVQGAARPSKTFTVRNVGTATLHLGRLTIPPQFSLLRALPTSLAPGSSTAFTIQLLTNVSGTFSGQLSLENNDANESPYNFGIKGVVTPVGVPRITVVGVSDGQATPINLGTVAKGTARPTRTFTVRNTGTATLILGNVSVPSNFTVTKALVRSLAPGASDTFTIAMNTNSEGFFSGDVRFSTNDASVNSFDFKVEGKVLDISSRYGQVVNWQTIGSQGYLMILKQVSISAGSAKRLYADFIGNTGSRIRSDVMVGNHQFSGNQGIPMVTVQSSGNYAIAWANSSLVPQQAGIHYVQMTRFGQVYGISDRFANIVPSNALTLSGITSDVTTGGFTIMWRSGTGKLWKRTFNVTGVPTSGEVAV